MYVSASRFKGGYSRSPHRKAAALTQSHDRGRWRECGPALQSHARQVINNGRAEGVAQDIEHGAESVEQPVDHHDERRILCRQADGVRTMIIVTRPAYMVGKSKKRGQIYLRNAGRADASRRGGDGDNMIFTRSRGMLRYWAMKMAATASYSAVPSMLMVEPTGMQKRTIRLSSPAPSSRQWKVTGMVAEEEEVPKAVAIAGDICRISRKGFRRVMAK
ncbi:hypothetical protein TYRP_016883 [Tyrophagus putrescentiae]|nr:hypothetical protein TYRP_016883 [Tyrophagus putrescentiae]